MSRERLYLGLDLGSVSLKAVVLKESGTPLFETYRRTMGRPIFAARELFAELSERFLDARFWGVYVTGSGKEMLAGLLGAGTVNEIVAHAEAAWTLYPQVKSIIEIGGQDSKLIRVGHGRNGSPYIEDHAFNELCAAGTGAFLDQQAGRLGLDIEQFGNLAAKAPRAARVAGRCSVFAKTDMIHLQQKACPTEEIALGLCFALARTYLVSLGRGKTPEAPVLFQGGVASNEGVRRAFRELLGLDDKDFLRPERSAVMGAYGAALWARREPLTTPRTLTELVQTLHAVGDSVDMTKDLPPLSRPERGPTAALKQLGASRLGWLGLDVGSVSTKAAVLDEDKHLVASAYLPTAGRPVEAIKKVLHVVADQLPLDFKFASMVTTGSGRHLARELIGAESAIDEISAQAKSTRHYAPEVDTVIEIGGQDAKFIRLSATGASNFQMNRACAAGTGAFLEEQAGRLGLSIAKDFAEAAFRSLHPSRLGSRCTVFMDSDLVHHLQRGAKTEDLCAGLAYSVAQNYLEKVVGSRPIGKRVLLQGGVAKNAAVHAAFQRLLDCSVEAHPYPEISGALGAAQSAAELPKANPRNLPLGRLDATTTSFECRRCENLCEIQHVRFEHGGSAHFGSVCGRFEEGREEPLESEDSFTAREKLLFAWRDEGFTPAPTREKIGLPQALSMMDDLPFWGTFLTRLGYEVVLSPRSRRDVVEWGLTHVPAEFCLPMKVLFGHVNELSRIGLTKVFLPHLRLFVPPGESEPRYACPYTQASPYVVRANTSLEVLSLEKPIPGEEDHWVRTAALELKLDEKVVRGAFHQAMKAEDDFKQGCVEEGARWLERLHREKRTGVVLLGRPYNTTDRYVNLNLARRLKHLGLEALPYDFLPLEGEELPAFWCRVRWGYGRKLVKAARIVVKNPDLAAIIVTNFGCGPDAFVDQYLEHELAETPHLVLEFDEHQAEAGLVTRIEAFARTLSRNRKTEAMPVIEAPDPGKSARNRRELTYYIPHFSDHAHAFIGALRASGCKAVLLPPTDDESWQLGLKHAYGRECHPFISFVGDLLKAAKDPGFVARDACYFGPSYFGPCLLPQYILAMKLILDRVGLSEVQLLNVADPNTMKQLGNGYLLRLAFGLYAIDRLYKWKVESEPYEVNTGEVAQVHAENVLRIEEGLTQGRFWRALDESVVAFGKVPLSPSAGSRPRVGILGDVYTRVNEHANDHLYGRLKDLGFEVWTSCSLVDVSFLGIEQLHEELLRKGQTVKGTLAKGLIPVIRHARGLIDRRFPESIRTPQERQFPDIRSVSDRYASVWIDKALSLNLSRVEEFAEAGAHGVINAMCHNCMLGTVTGALMPALRKDYPSLSMGSLIYEGLQSTHNANRLEAFAHQVTSRKEATGQKN